MALTVSHAVHRSAPAAPTAGVVFGVSAELLALTKEIERAEAAKAALEAKIIADTRARQAAQHPFYEAKRNEKRQKIIDTIARIGPSTTHRIASVSGYDVSSLRKYLVAMADEGLVEPGGSRARVVWSLSDA